MWFRVLLIVILALILVTAAQAVPKMYLPQEDFDFGFAPQNSKLTHVFWIKSVGDDSLKILSVKPG